LFPLSVGSLVFLIYMCLFDLEQARPLLEDCAIEELVDPQLGNHYSEQEVFCMLNAASLCIQRDPHSRPRMSQVRRKLEDNNNFSTYRTLYNN